MQMEPSGQSFNTTEMLLETERKFIDAAKTNNVEAMRLWGQGLNINVRNVHGVAPIHLAAWFSCVAILKMLEGFNIFHCAAINNHTEILQYILEDLQMKELDKPDASGDTPLHLAAGNGHLDVVEMLLRSFETRDEGNMAEQTALYLAADSGHEECTRALLRAGCNPNIVTLTKRSPLHPVAERGDTSMLRLLLDYDAQTDFQDQRSQTAMHLAAELARVEIIEMLLKTGVDLTLCDKHNKTALGVAARADEVVIVDMVIKAERWNAWMLAHPEPNENLHSQRPLTFKLDHRQETKPFRSMVWHLTYQQLKPGDWKRLAEHWEFTKEQVEAIEEQWTGQHSYREHGNRMLLIWHHGVELAGQSPSKELYQGLIQTSNRTVADRLRMHTEKGSNKYCNIS
ncbi:hypothetical protein NHX12_029449 [Muraenolepis orangiensis]|uniref:Death domain-containing protein n=1 Tax=Muraenolepis orangiensis TaxID=630683 RepID=A0A9Q0EDR5_9TELE|nr:hypothetical protein NHX12_029449 [Muraenolepis orangiensis]